MTDVFNSLLPPEQDLEKHKKFSSEFVKFSLFSSSKTPNTRETNVGMTRA